MAEDALAAQPINGAESRTFSQCVQRLSRDINKHSKTNIDQETILPRGAERDIFSSADVKDVVKEVLRQTPSESTPTSSLDDIVTRIREHNLRTFAVLIWHGGQLEALAVLVKHVQAQINANEAAGLDAKLPLSKQEAAEVWPADECSISNAFLDLQKLVAIHVIVKGASNVIKNTYESSPILEMTVISTAGTTATVYKARLVKGGWRPRSDSENLNDFEIVVAIKSFDGRNIETSEKNMQQEKKFLEDLEGSGSSHKNVLVKHYGTLRDEARQKASLILPLGDHSLEDLFESKEGSGLDYRIGTMQDFLTAFAHLADGIRLLHEGVIIEGKRWVIFQQDLQPSNMLFKKRATGWDLMLADYGMARKVGSDERDLKNSRTGAYASPDDQLTAASEDFSLACMLVDAVSFKMCGPDFVQKFSDKRAARNNKNNQFWMRNEIGDVVMNPAVNDWIEEMKTRADMWDIHIGECIKHILDALVEHALIVSPNRSDGKGPGGIAMKINEAIHTGLIHLKKQKEEPKRPGRMYQNVERSPQIQPPTPTIQHLTVPLQPEVCQLLGLPCLMLTV